MVHGPVKSVPTMHTRTTVQKDLIENKLIKYGLQAKAKNTNRFFQSKIGKREVLKWRHLCIVKVYLSLGGHEKSLTCEGVKVMGAWRSAQPDFLYRYSLQHHPLFAWRSETFHILVFLKALIDREYPCCQSKWASCPRLGGDFCRSSETTCFERSLKFRFNLALLSMHTERGKERKSIT